MQKVTDADGNVAALFFGSAPVVPEGYSVSRHKANALVKLKPLDAPLALNEVKAKRNALLDNYAWTVLPQSPLTNASKAKWLVYLKQLHKVTKDLKNAEDVTWPTQPKLEYDPA